MTRWARRCCSGKESLDYRYFPSRTWCRCVWREWLAIQRHRRAPAAWKARLQSQYGLSAYDASVLTRGGPVLARYFEEVARVGDDAKDASNWITNDVQQILNERKLGIEEFPLSAEALGGLVRHMKQTGLPKQRGREIFADMLTHGGTAEESAKRLGIAVVADEDQLRDSVRRAIAANPKAVADFKNGKTKAADAIKGAIMRETKGAPGGRRTAAAPGRVAEAVRDGAQVCQSQPADKARARTIT